MSEKEKVRSITITIASEDEAKLDGAAQNIVKNAIDTIYGAELALREIKTSNSAHNQNSNPFGNNYRNSNNSNGNNYRNANNGNNNYQKNRNFTQNKYSEQSDGNEERKFTPNAASQNAAQ
jgi:hypothetical protein